MASNYQGNAQYRSTNQHEDFQQGRCYSEHSYTTQSAYNDTGHGPSHPQIRQRLSHHSIQQQDDLSRRSQNLGIPNLPSHSTFSNGGRFQDREISSLEQNFDQMLHDEKHDNADEERPSNNPTPHVTEVHTLRPSRHEMPDHYSYHGDISGNEAKRILKENSKRNCYLTRYSNNNQKYILSVIFVYKNQDKVCHYELSINTQESRYSLEGTDFVFDTLDKLLKYYESSPLNPDIRNIGMACLVESTPGSSQQPQTPAESLYTDQACKELCEMVKKEINKTFRQSQCYDQQPDPQSQAPPLQSQVSQPQQQPQPQANVELELIKDMLKQQQETNKEVLNRLAEQQKTNQDLIDKIPKSRCTIL